MHILYGYGSTRKKPMPLFTPGLAFQLRKVFYCKVRDRQVPVPVPVFAIVPTVSDHI